MQRLFLLAVPLAVQAALREYTLDLTVGESALDGVNRKTYLVNNQTPGPELLADQGDQLKIVVNNHLGIATTIHWHGIEQKGTPWSDGVPGITQKMIADGESFTYEFVATEPGTYWYHSHSRATYNDGLRGTIYIRPSSIDPASLGWSEISSDQADLDALKNAHMHPRWLAVHEWKHITSEEDWAAWNATNIEQVCEDSIIVNGRGQVICMGQEFFDAIPHPIIDKFTPKGCAFPNNTLIQPFPNIKPEEASDRTFFDCTATESPLSVIQVDPASKWASLALANLGGMWELKVNIDGHKLWVYSADGAFVQPQEVDAISIPVGERFQAFIKLNATAQDYTIRVAANVLPQMISGYAVLSYKKPKEGAFFNGAISRLLANPTTFNSAPADFEPKMGFAANLLANATELNALALKSAPASAPPESSKVTDTFVLNFARVDALQWAMNVDPFSIFRELEEPLLFKPDRISGFDTDTMLTAKVGDVVDVVFNVSAPNPPHPIHKHGKKAWVIGAGPVGWKWPSVEEAVKEVPQFFNIVDPPKRDGFNTLPAALEATFYVIRYEVTEPFLTLLHCHILAHQVSGMTNVIAEGIDSLPQIPQQYLDAFNGVQAESSSAPPSGGGGY